MLISRTLSLPFVRITKRLMEPPVGMAFDFSEPKGEASLTRPDSVSWRIFKNPVSLFAAGVAAVLMELAEPSVRAGVWDHSSFRKDPVMRLRRTGFTAMMTVYGPRSAAEEMIARVVRMHGHVRGQTSEGTPYHANDSRLLDWVQATASFGFIEAYHQLVRPLSPDQRSQAFAEASPSARLYGAVGAPTSMEAWTKLLDVVEPNLIRTPTIFEFLEIMRDAPILPSLLRPLQRLMIGAAVDILPGNLRIKLGLQDRGLSAMQHQIVKSAGGLADRLPIRTSPSCQACVRMGLPFDYLYSDRH
jgi:uncharacterized protein (DUF2236 family)